MKRDSTCTRRDFLVNSSKLLALGAMAHLSGCSSLSKSTSWLDRSSAITGSGKEKNVLFVIYDDLKPMLNCYGHPQIQSPNFDSLAREGLLFNRTYCQYPVCGPSRQSFLTGLRPDSTGIYDNRLVTDDMMGDTISLPKHFKNHGYHTLSIGKVYHNPMHQDLAAWSEEPQAIATHVYLDARNIELAEKAKQEGLEKGLTWDEIRGNMLVAATEAADVPDDQYMPGAHTNIALEKLREMKNLGRPFFMAYGCFRPHLPFNAPRRYWDLYSPDDIRFADNPFRPEGARYIRAQNYEFRAYTDIRDEVPFSKETERRLIHGYYACVSYIDAQLGRLLDELKELGMYDDTIIAIIGDHGFHLGDHDLWGKFTHFETAARAPMIFRVPDMRGGIRTDALTEFVDIYPTLSELAGLPLPEHLEGTSAVPLFSNPNRTWKKAAFTQYHLGDAWGRSMKTDRYRYTRWTHHPTGEHLDDELYDHQVDPQENGNIAHQPENRKIIARLKELMGQGWQGALPRGI